jgi:hypothetical protein
MLLALLLSGLLPVSPALPVAVAQAQTVALPAPAFSPQRGYYTDPIQVALTSVPGATIRYTINGDTPTPQVGAVYTGSISLQTTTVLRAIAYTTPNTKSAVVTHTYLFLDDVRQQSNTPPTGWPAIFAANYDGLAVDRWGKPFTPNGYPADYEMDPQIVNHPNYTGRIEEALLDIPTVSLVTELGNLWNPASGIYYNPNDRAGDPSSDPDPLYPASGFDPWERPVSIEWFAPAQWFSGTQSAPASVGELAGAKIYGQTSRRPKNTPKRSFEISFKTQYGSGTLDFALFDWGDPTTTVNQLILHNGGNRTWSYHDRDQRSEADYINNEWSRRTWLQMGHLGPRGTYAHLYINGLYWGVYNITERPGVKFLQAYLGGLETDYDYIVSEEEARDIPVAAGGTTAAYATIISKLGDTVPITAPLSNVQLAPTTPITTQNLNSPINDATYQELAALMDMENFADYMLHTHYIGKTDWPNHNYNAYRKKVGPDTRLKWFTWDDDSGLNNQDRQWDLPNKLLDYRATPSWIFLRLLTNAEFRQLYIDRIYRHMVLPYDPVAQTGALTPQNCAAVYTELAGTIDPAIIGESARWGDYARDVYARPDASPNKALPAYLYSYDLVPSDTANFTVTWPITNPAYSTASDKKSWKTVTTEKLIDYCPERTASLLSQYGRSTIRLRGMASTSPTQTLSIRIWPSSLVTPPLYGQRGGAVPSNYGLLITNPNTGSAGDIYYTVDGSDPRALAGAASVSAIPGGDSVTVTISQVTRVKARIKQNDKWSPLIDYIFYPPQPLDQLVINEIHYNPLTPAGVDGDQYEFIELYNKGNTPLRLDNVQFTRGINYQFPEQTTVAPGQYLVLAADPATFSTRYPGVPVFGEFQGSLSNDGEVVELRTGLVDFNGNGGALIDRVEFDDDHTTQPWPLLADGTGPSLELNDPALDNALAVHWHSSGLNHGTPGAANSVPPVVAISSPVSGTVALLGASLAITATASDQGGTVTQVEFFANNALITGCVDTVAPYACPWTPALAGVYSLTAKATDNDNGVALSTPVAVTINEPANQLPAVSISSPVSGANAIVGAVVAIQATASDPDGTIANVSFAANGTPINGCVDTTAPFICSWTPATPGTYLLTATATDNKGGTTTSAAVSVTSNDVNNQPPTVAISSPAAGSNFAVGQAVTLAATASDPDGTVAQVAFFANGTQIGSCVDTAAPYECSWTPTTAGIHSLTAQALDNGGSTTISPIVAVTANQAGNQLPTGSINSPAAGATVQVGQTVVIAATASDPDGTVAEVTFYANGVEIFNCVDSTAPFACVWQPPAAGTYNLTLLVKDNQGGTALSAPVAVTSIVSDNQPPTAAILSPATGENFLAGTAVTIAANATDTDGTITQVTFFANGVPINGCVDTAAPFTCSWTANPVGLVNLTVEAVDNNNIATFSDTVVVTVNTGDNEPPSVAISSPANGANFPVGEAVTIDATASDSNGTVTQVAFFVNGEPVVGCMDTSAPYSCSWTPSEVGSYNLTAQATDNGGATTVSAIVAVTANTNPPPTVTITSPSNGQTVQVGQPVVITVNAAVGASSANVPVASIVQVEFFANNVPIAGCIATNSPFECVWTPTVAGVYNLTAEAIDDLGSVGRALDVTVTVTDNPITGERQLFLPLVRSSR